MLWSPDARVPCYFSSLQLPLGWILPDPGPWEKKRKRKIISRRKKKSPLHPHTAPPTKNFLFFKEKVEGMI